MSQVSIGRKNIVISTALVIGAAVIIILFGFGQVIGPPSGPKCSTLVTTETTGTFFPYSTWMTTYTTSGTIAVTHTLTIGGTVEGYVTTTSVTCG
jgi:hypothetical protein